MSFKQKYSKHVRVVLLWVKPNLAFETFCIYIQSKEAKQSQSNLRMAVDIIRSQPRSLGSSLVWRVTRDEDPGHR